MQGVDQVSNRTTNAVSLSNIRSYLLVALIFEALTLVAAAWGLYGILGGVLAISNMHTSNASVALTGVGAYFVWGGLGAGLVYCVLAVVLTIPVMVRTNRMLSAANRVDIVSLKKLSSAGWAIVALIFSLVIPGIMLLIADGPINSLEERGGVGQWQTRQ